jgi:hypothetical protein
MGKEGLPAEQWPAVKTAAAIAARPLCWALGMRLPGNVREQGDPQHDTGDGQCDWQVLDDNHD